MLNSCLPGSDILHPGSSSSHLGFIHTHLERSYHILEILTHCCFLNHCWVWGMPLRHCQAWDASPCFLPLGPSRTLTGQPISGCLPPVNMKIPHGHNQICCRGFLWLPLPQIKCGFSNLLIVFISILVFNSISNIIIKRTNSALTQWKYPFCLYLRLISGLSLFCNKIFS